MKIINGKKLQEEILTKIKKEVALLKFIPVFTDVLVGGDPASAIREDESKSSREGWHPFSPCVFSWRYNHSRFNKRNKNFKQANQHVWNYYSTSTARNTEQESDT